MDEFSGSARALVFVVDSNTVSKQVRDVAEYLHFLLSNKNINSNRWGRVKVDSFDKFCCCYQGTQQAHTVYSFFLCETPSQPAGGRSLLASFAAIMLTEVEPDRAVVIRHQQLRPA